MIKKMNFGYIIEKEPSSRQQVAYIDLILTILQNSTQGLEFHDFTDNERLVWRMRRREHDLAREEGQKTEAQMSRLEVNFEQHRKITVNALAEFVTLVEQVKQELSSEVQGLKERN